MKEPHIAARAADLAHAREDQRQSELDELVSALKRLMIDTMARENDFAALRAIDMIARLRGLTPTTAKRSDGLETALEEMRRQQPETDEAEAEEAEAEDADPTSSAAPGTAAPDTVALDTVFDPPMPPELRPPVEPTPRPRTRTVTLASPDARLPPTRRPAPPFAAVSSATNT